MAKTARKTAETSDLFAETARPALKPVRGKAAPAGEAYTARDIEVLEGLEPVRRRPGMYIGGTDEKALHHLFAEVIDNAMDEALAGHADWIDVSMSADGFVTVLGGEGRGDDRQRGGHDHRRADTHHAAQRDQGGRLGDQGRA